MRLDLSRTFARNISHIHLVYYLTLNFHDSQPYRHISFTESPFPSPKSCCFLVSSAKKPRKQQPYSEHVNSNVVSPSSPSPLISPWEAGVAGTSGATLETQVLRSPSPTTKAQNVSDIEHVEFASDDFASEGDSGSDDESDSEEDLGNDDSDAGSLSGDSDVEELFDETSQETSTKESKNQAADKWSVSQGVELVERARHHRKRIAEFQQSSRSPMEMIRAVCKHTADALGHLPIPEETFDLAERDLAFVQHLHSRITAPNEPTSYSSSVPSVNGIPKPSHSKVRTFYAREFAELTVQQARDCLPDFTRDSPQYAHQMAPILARLESCTDPQDRFVLGYDGTSTSNAGEGRSKTDIRTNQGLFAKIHNYARVHGKAGFTITITNFHGVTSNRPQDVPVLALERLLFYARGVDDYSLNLRYDGNEYVTDHTKMKFYDTCVKVCILFDHCYEGSIPGYLGFIENTFI